jgi:hypothetical protein
MKTLYGLIAGIALAGVAPLALADADPFFLMPDVGGAEITQYEYQGPAAKSTSTEVLDDSFWYAGTSGVPSN